jgi:hypothetical protein
MLIGCRILISIRWSTARANLLRLDEIPIGIGEPYFLQISKPPLCLLGDDLKKIY